ncbi:hypothetical protein GCM10009863_19610 [Streptomyces axinellae]|uniref:Uncharacterized protein n=1 Tax=Streptomyces axinellae TaxID=552788 RepID=A0ABP6C9P9_9ACTN
MGHIELVETHLAQVRLEMDPDVGVVAAVAPLAEPFLPREPDVEPFGYRHLRVECLSCCEAPTRFLVIGKRLFLPRAVLQHVADCHMTRRVVLVRYGEKCANLVDLLLCIVGGLESAASEFATRTIWAVGQLVADGPGPVTAVLELRARLAVVLSGLRVPA